jgi:acyl transferase domain-containing protein/thioesterase domain-containing protein/acyl carrier protein
MARDDEDLDGRIAIIGMAGRLPGARDLTQFWSNLRRGVESIQSFSEDELLAAGESLDNIRDPSYVRAAAPLDDIDQFDAGFFGMSPRDAAVFDPQHRLFLECAWDAFEHAGYVGERIDGAVGVFASCGLSEYMFKNVLANEHVATSVGEWLVRHTGNDTNFLATRVSYELDLHGPSLNIQTACSSTLVAVHLACQSLLSGECDVALAGGAVVSPVQRRGYFYKEGEILSPDGHCRAFDAKSAGTIISSACGAVVLKPLADALDDGDNVLAVVRGSAINNDGRAKVGYLAPSVPGQAQVVTEALAVAGVDPRDVTYIEAHGTGTLIGDPIEVAGLTQAYRLGTDDRQYCAIGSLKTNIGHTGEASGVSALIKTVLSLQHREIPPSLHYEEPNPQADFPNSPFFVNAALRPWEPGPSGTRIAGITGLGAGGTNAHLIVEEAPPTESSSPSRPAQLITVAGRTADAARRAATDLAAHLRAHPDLDLADVAYTRLAGRKPFAMRRAVVATSPGEAADALEAPGKPVDAHHHGEAPSVVFMMPGGGAQYAGMGRQLYEDEPVYRAVIDDCAEALRAAGGIDLLAALFPDGDLDAASVRLEAPSIALPALFATEVAMGRLLESWGITPAAMIGHSAGEYAAACLSDVVSMEDGLALVALRGRLFETLPKGAMVSVPLAEDELRALLPDGLSIAAINAPELCVASGPEALVEELEATLAARDIDSARIHIDVAAHSSMLEPILAEFGTFCRRTTFNPPTIPYVSNLTGTWVTGADVTDPDYWVRHLRSAVRFRDGIDTILADSNRVLLEIGPGRTLAGLARQAPVTAAAISPTLRHPKEVAFDVAFALAAVGRAWEAGVELDPATLFADEERHRLPLPTYPFEHQRYWVEPDAADAPRATSKGVLRKRPLVDEWFSTPSWRRAIAKPLAEAVAAPVVVIADGSPLASALAADLAATRRVVSVVLGERFQRRAGGGFEVNPARADDWSELVDALSADGVLPGTIVHMTAVGPSRGRRLFGVGPEDDLVAYRETVERDHASMLFLARALSALAEPVRLALVTSGVHGLDSADPLLPERALLHGDVRVIPRELGHVDTIAIDVDTPQAGTPAAAGLVAAIAHELDAEWGTDVVVLRRGERWVRTLEPVTLMPTVESPWQPHGVHLITGGFGGIGLSIAEHIAKSSDSPTLVLVGRSPLPPESSWEAAVAAADTDPRTRQRIDAILQLRTFGAQVVVAPADVTDEAAMAAVVADVRRRHGRISTVIHSAGILHDALIALRTPVAESAVVDVKAKGALVLGRVFKDAPPDLFVLFSSVSSIIGLPGQIDYTAANAFLDAYAAKANRGDSSARSRTRSALTAGRSRALVVNWNAWQEVGMAVEAARVERDQAPVVGVEPASATHLFDAVDDDDEVATFSTGFSRKRHWLLNEHVVRGGEALIPGTGYLELARAAAASGQPNRAVELSDVFFLAPFVVGDGEVRTLKVKLDRATDSVTVFSDTETSPHVTATAVAVDPEPRPVHDIAAIRARCTRRVERYDGYSDQPFMAFGPRWGSLRSIEYGDDEALVTTVMPVRFAGELADLWLHPALMDIATGSAQALIPGFAQTEMFYVPFSYGRVLSRRPLPAHAVSHVRLRTASANDLAVFDITICDEHGDEAVAIESFTMRRISGAASLTSLRRTESPIAEPAGIESTVGSAMREGILPSEGVDAFDRIVGSGLAVQVVASSVDVERWMAKVDAEAAAADDDSAGSGGPQYERPNISSDFAAPATPIERELATMWRELLGVERVGRDDDFFELGGQSLIAVRLFTRMKKRYSIDLPLSTLFEAPTIGECAAIVAAKLGVDDPVDDGVEGAPAATAEVLPLPPPIALNEPGFRSLVTIQRGSENQIPFFCIHGSGGNVLNFRDLSQAMGRSQPFYGVQSRGIDGVSRPHHSIEEMAAAYLTEIREVQPEGPYMLGGYSGGGLVAFEMAHQLTAAGETVALLVMFDTFPPKIPDRDITVAMRLRRLRDERMGYLNHIVTRRLDARRDAAMLARAEEIAQRGGVVPVELRDMHVQHSFVRAADKYVLRPWRGHVVLMRAEEMGFEAEGLGQAYGWDDVIAGGVEVVQVPGNHDTLVLEPNATTLVQQLRATLDRTQALRARRGDQLGAVSAGD